jgi:hypothetical protein
MGIFDGIKNALAKPSDVLPTRPMPQQNQDGGNDGGEWNPFGGGENLPVYMGGLQSTGFSPGRIQLMDDTAQGSMVANCEEIERLTNQQIEQVYPALEKVIQADTNLHGRQMETAKVAIDAVATQQRAAGSVQVAAIQAGLGLVGVRNEVRRARKFASGYTQRMMQGQ